MSSVMLASRRQGKNISPVLVLYVRSGPVEGWFLMPASPTYISTGCQSRRSPTVPPDWWLGIVAAMPLGRRTNNIALYNSSTHSRDGE